MNGYVSLLLFHVSHNLAYRGLYCNTMSTALDAGKTWVCALEVTLQSDHFLEQRTANTLGEILLTEINKTN